MLAVIPTDAVERGFVAACGIALCLHTRLPERACRGEIGQSGQGNEAACMIDALEGDEPRLRDAPVAIERDHMLHIGPGFVGGKALGASMRPVRDPLPHTYPVVGKMDLSSCFLRAAVLGIGAPGDDGRLTLPELMRQQEIGVIQRAVAIQKGEAGMARERRAQAIDMLEIMDEMPGMRADLEEQRMHGRAPALVMVHTVAGTGVVTQAG